MDVGLALSINRELTGQSVNQTYAFPLYENLEVNRYTTGLKIGILGRAKVEYSITPSIGFRASIGHKQFISNWIEDSGDINSKPNSWNYNIGLVKQF